METMLQYFEWNLPADGTLWKTVQEHAAWLADLGITMVWLPPAYKGQAGRNDVGYGVYDMYDLGEFDAKGSVATKYGTREEYVRAVEALREQGLDVLADIVFNHRMGADYSEHIQATNMDWNHRDTAVGDLHPAQVWTGYSFPARSGKYSSFQWTWKDFTGTDYDQNTGDKGLLEFQGKEWNRNVSGEQDNFDFIMGDDVDFSSPRVRRELYRWGRWYLTQAPVSGFRMDAVKSIDSGFFAGWLKAMRRELECPAFAVGEWWSGDVNQLRKYLDDSGRCMTLFDVPLHFRLQQASCSNGGFDLRTLYDDTLMESDPDWAVPFVDNHDTQKGQALESWVMDWFRPQANAILLLGPARFPCVFYGDLFGLADGTPKTRGIEELLKIRSRLHEGKVKMYDTQDPQMLAWKSEGDHPFFVILTEAAGKSLPVSEPELAGTAFTDALDEGRRLRFDENGNTVIHCPDGSLSVWVRDEDLPLIRN